MIRLLSCITAEGARRLIGVPRRGALISAPRGGVRLVAGALRLWADGVMATGGYIFNGQSYARRCSTG